MSKTHLRASARWLLLGLSLVLLASCRDAPTKPIGALMPDFTLVDVNPNSATTQQSVTPRAYLSKVSAWYFGHAT